MCTARNAEVCKSAVNAMPFILQNNNSFPGDTPNTVVKSQTTKMNQCIFFFVDTGTYSDDMEQNKQNKSPSFLESGRRI